MFERKLTQLEIRKQLLVAESEVNRALVTEEYRAMAEDFHEVTAPLRNVREWAQKATAIFSMIKSLRPEPSPEEASHRLPFSMRLLRFATAMWVGTRRNGRR